MDYNMTSTTAGDGSTVCGVPGEKFPYPEDPPPPTITQNITYPFPIHQYPSWEVGLKVSTYVVAMSMAVIGNAVVIITVAFNRRRIKIPGTTLYLVNLAVSDFMVGALNMWMHLIVGIQDAWPFDSFLCKLFPFLQIVFLVTSVLFMAVIAVDRFIAVVFPLRSRLSQPYQHAIVIVCTWSLAVGVASPILVVRKLEQLYWANYHEVWCTELWPRYVAKDQPAPDRYCLYYYPDRQIYYSCQAVVMYMVPVLVMLLAYGVILWKMKERRLPGEQTDQIVLAQQKATRRMVRLLVVVLGVFIVCWTPQEIIVFLDANWPQQTEELSDDVRYAAIFVAYFNSALNPFIYAGLHEQLRRGIVDVFARRRHKILPAASTRDNDCNNNSSNRMSSVQRHHDVSSSANGSAVVAAGDDTKLSAAPGAEDALTVSSAVLSSRACTRDTDVT